MFCSNTTLLFDSIVKLILVFCVVRMGSLKAYLLSTILSSPSSSIFAVSFFDQLVTIILMSETSSLVLSNLKTIKSFALSKVNSHFFTYLLILLGSL